MLGQLHDDRIGDSGDVGADQGGVEHVDRVPDAGDDDLGFIAVVVEGGPDILDDFYDVLGDVVQPPDEGGDVGRTGLGGQERLEWGENKSDIGLDLLAVQG